MAILTAYTELAYIIKFDTHSLWQKMLTFVMKEYFTLYNKVNKPLNFNLKCRDNVIIPWIRTGHSRMIHSYPLKGEHQPECSFSY